MTQTLRIDTTDENYTTEGVTLSCRMDIETAQEGIAFCPRTDGLMRCVHCGRTYCGLHRTQTLGRQMLHSPVPRHHRHGQGQFEGNGSPLNAWIPAAKHYAEWSDCDREDKSSTFRCTDSRSYMASVRSMAERDDEDR